MTSRSRGRPRDQPSRSQLSPRDELVEAATKVIARNGLAATTVRDVANEVGVSRTAVYHHFGGRAGLIAAVGDTVLRPLFDKISELEQNHTPPVENLASYLLFEAHLLRATPVPVIALLTSPELASPVHAGLGEAIDGISAAIDRWVQQCTGLSPEDRARRITFAAGAILGLLALQPEYPAEELTEIVHLELELLGIDPHILSEGWRAGKP